MKVAEVKQPISDQIQQDLAELTGQTERLERLRNRLVGSLPEPGEKSEGNPPSCCLLDDLKYTGRAINDCRARMELALTEIESKLLE